MDEKDQEKKLNLNEVMPTQKKEYPRPDDKEETKDKDKKDK